MRSKIDKTGDQGLGEKKFRGLSMTQLSRESSWESPGRVFRKRECVVCKGPEVAEKNDFG